MNYSRQRKKILQTLQLNVVHPTAEYIHTVLQNEDSKIGLATVYRNLNQLAQNGNIKRIRGLEESVHYDHNTHRHYHFLCSRCGKIYDVPDSVAPDIIRRTEMSTGFIIEEHEINFKGICKDCIKNTVKKEEK